MNWARHYEVLMERARTRVLDGYREMHHVVPRCLGGADDAGNLGALTAREHYVAHILLVRMHAWRGEARVYVGFYWTLEEAKAALNSV